MRRMGAIIDTVDLSITFKADPHRSLRIHVEDGAPREVYTVLEGMQLPPHQQSLVAVSRERLGLSTEMTEGEWREISPYHATERIARVLIAPGVSKGPVVKMLVANCTAEVKHLRKGTRVATGELMKNPKLTTYSRERPSGLYDEFEYELPPKPKRQAPVDMEKVSEELGIPQLKKQLTQQQYGQLVSLLNKYQSLWSTQEMPLQQTDAAEHTIETGTAKPIAQHPRPTGPNQKKEIEKQIQEMLQDEVIRESRSPWSSPIVLVKKKDGSVRFCVDYRKLNEVTTRDHYPLPRTEDILDTLGRSKFFTTLDLRSGYWQVPVKEEDKKKTAFVSYAGLYEYNVMPFGLTNAPATFQRLMDAVLAGLRWQTCLVYLDDIIIFSPDFETHLHRLDLVFQRLSESNLVLCPNKCELFQTKVAYLGHVVSADGIVPQESKLEKVRQFQSQLQEKLCEPSWDWQGTIASSSRTLRELRSL